MRRIAALAATTAVAASLASPAVASTKTVTWNFSPPATLAIKKNDTVKFSWSGGLPHNVVGKGFKSGSPKAKGTYSRKFTSKGTFTVYCAPHSSIMVTKITVS
jgi:plastocyanin